ncbi:hypothetical protein OHA72_12410 [Dactylosporangium sp. NBC_01737]|uniref:hypothetical protein n=1 Tax=Dactylosporangium sp. NBC_01737 TaxID=2975959 RepID=UPI002E127319|nr:hypothetical protein OHA72_12410 [Dactylosporangium sp. NBC_01737]
MLTRQITIEAPADAVWDLVGCRFARIRDCAHRDPGVDGDRVHHVRGGTDPATGHLPAEDDGLGATTGASGRNGLLVW